MFELPIGVPPKTSHLFYALPIAVAFNNDSIKNWYYSEFIQWYTYRDVEIGDGVIRVRLYDYDDLFDIEPLETIQIKPYRLNIGNKIIDHFKDLLDYGYYIYVFLDFEKLDNIKKIRHRYTELLLYGYDNTINCFLVYTYNDLYLEKFYITYNEFFESYYSEHIKHFDNKTILYKPKNKNYDINIEKIKWHLLDYIESVDTRRRECPQSTFPFICRWGIDCYDELVYMCQWIYENESNFNKGDPLCVFEHKKDMVDRIKYLSAHTILDHKDEIIDLFSQVKNQAEIIFNMTLKYNYIQNSNKRFQMIELLIKRIINMRDIEKVAMTKYYNYNQKQFESI